MNCSQLYLGIDHQVLERDDDLFAIELSPSGSPEAVAIRKILGTKYIYYLAPHTGCGCGWDYLGIGTPNDDKSKASCEMLEKFLIPLERQGQVFKIFSVCSESIDTHPESEARLSVADFMANIRKYRVPFASNISRVYVVGT